jgi:hypothetical protein
MWKTQTLPKSYLKSQNWYVNVLLRRSFIRAAEGMSQGSLLWKSRRSMGTLAVVMDGLLVDLPMIAGAIFLRPSSHLLSKLLI